MIEKKYTIAKFTRQGYIELLEALSKEEHGLCVFYWNGCFNTMCKKNEELYFLATNEDEPLVGWKKLDEIKLFLKSSIRQPEISVAVVCDMFEGCHALRKIEGRNATVSNGIGHNG
ncbi:hypothetical protein Pyn_37492 [Prunus yedoensis var. nudiflora]|uniref:MINDY deubiquitinase domain-containing protein n=1 Tax=Prunus yedoensis var. nudiflora TaxID=2094558 RepID=A0A314Y9P8_PRUYE|nr:hypothetical protein Pyn_37492 [Prunus yedoensis var. nudiflora]